MDGKNNGKKIFGTDGIRGVANEYPITAEMALSVGKAVAHYFLSKNGTRTHRIVIGKDTRLSGYMLETSLTAGILSMGCDVLLVGPLPTPAIAHLTKSLNCDAGIVISASHNPADHNGIKIFANDGFKLSDEQELEIEGLILGGTIESGHIKGARIGKAYRVDEAKGRYIEYAKHSIKSTPLEGLFIVLDCANGAAYNIAPKILQELGAKVLVLNDNPDGLNINLNCGALHPESMQKAVAKYKADIGIALDGDADRIIVCDENGKIVDGDHIIAILALELKAQGKLDGNAVVGTVMSNIGFHKAMKENGIDVITAPVGDRYVIDELRKHNLSFGGEQSGHIIFFNYSTTGDGIITALMLLDLMKKKGKKISELASVMETAPQVLLNVHVNQKRALAEMPSVAKAIASAETVLGADGRVLVRYSGTENIARVMLEGMDETQIRKHAEQIAGEIKREIGV
ncbi:MAG: phosphoglucosamine mutase [Candidatus Diapherotrites archaeon]|nr:phosphoglucosamine mutase [Candidatus Micrarchaeota archaeon]